MFSPFSTKAPCTYRLTSFAKELFLRGHDVSIVLPSLDRHSDFLLESEKCIGGVKLIRPHQFRSRNLETAMLPYVLSSILKSFSLRCDIIHVLKPVPLSCPSYFKRLFYGTPIVQDIDDLDHVVMNVEKHPKWRIWVTEQFEKLLPRLADHIITSSSYLKELYLGMGIVEDRITWIPNGVNVSEFDVEPDYSIKARYNLKEKVIVYVGSLNNETQLFPLIRAMRFIVTGRNDTCFLIIGDGLAKRNLEMLTHKLGINKSVIFIGRIPHKDVSKFLSISDIGIACFPSLDWIQAASNIKVFEYMASGVPVIVSATGDLPYYVDFGATGVIAKFNVRDLSMKLDELLDDDRKRKRLGEKARRYVKENFDWQVLTGKVEKIYEKTMCARA